MFFRNMLCWNLFINNKIEFEYDSRVKNISKHTSKLVWTCSIQVQSTKYISAVHWELVCLDETLMFYLKIFENSHIFEVFSKILKKSIFCLDDDVDSAHPNTYMDTHENFKFWFSNQVMLKSVGICL